MNPIKSIKSIKSIKPIKFINPLFPKKILSSALFTSFFLYTCSTFASAHPISPDIFNGYFARDFSQSIAQGSEQNHIQSLLQILSTYPEDQEPPMMIGVKGEFDSAWSDNTNFTYVPPFNGYNNPGNTATRTWVDKIRIPLMANYHSWWHAEIQSQAKGNDVSVLDGAIIYGDFNQSPLYYYLGKQYIDFAPFYTFIPYNDPLNKAYFRPLVHDVALAGFYNQDVFSTLSIFKTNSTNNNNGSGPQINNFAYQFIYDFNKNKNTDFKLGASYLSNINKDSAGLENLSGSNNTQLPAADLNAYLSFNAWTALAEYDTTTKSVLNINHQKTKISAYDLELAYNYAWLKPSTFSLGYSWTHGLNGVDGAGLNNTSQPWLGNSGMFSSSVAMMLEKNFWLSFEYDRVGQYTELAVNSPTKYYSIGTCDVVWFF